MIGTTTELLPVLMDAGVRGLVLLAVAGLLSLALWRASAALRHLVWAAALSGLLAMPVLTAVMPRVEVGVPALAGVISARMTPATTPAWNAAASSTAGTPGVAVAGEVAAAGRAEMPAAGASAEAGEAAAAARVPPSPTSPSSPLRQAGAGSWLLTGWLLGLVALLAPVAAGWWGIRRLESRSRRLTEPRVAHLATRLALRIGVKREFRLLAGPAGAMPMTWGILRPAIMLPADAVEWPPSRLEAVLAHELAHVARRDCLTQLVAELARAVHWFNPLVWLAARRLRVEREHACDDVALAGGTLPSAYAQELLDLAQRYRASRTTSMAAVAMARPSQLTGRLLAVLDEQRRRGRLGRTAVLRGALMAALIAVPISAMAPDARAADDGATRAGLPLAVQSFPDLPSESPRQDPVSCAAEPNASWNTMSNRSNNGRYRVEMKRRGCELDVRLEGDVVFDPAGVAIERMGRGALLRIEEAADRTDRYLEVTSADGGAPRFEYRLNGRDAPFDASAQAWYRSVLLQLFRRAGFAAEARVESLLRQGGVEAVLRELGQLESSYVFAKYTAALLERAALDEAALRALVRSSARRVDSDHYMSEILKAVAAHQPLQGGILDDFITASTQLDSDHYRSEVLKAALSSDKLNVRQAEAVLVSVSHMDSDHYRSEILESIAGRYAQEPAIRDAYLRSAAELDSDHYRSEVLERLLERGDLSAQEKAAVLASAQSMDSDHYRSQILERVARGGLGSDAIRRAYFESIDGLDSDHYRSEALEVLIEDAELQPDLLVAVLASAARLDSDHYLSEVLVRVVERQRLEGATREAFLLAMDAVDSDHYRGQVADALLRAERR